MSESASDQEDRNIRSESEGDDDLEDSDSQEYRPERVSDDLRREYASFAAFQEHLRQYSAATFQSFIKRRSEKLKKNNLQLETIQYKKLVYKCVHHSQYKPEGDGKRPSNIPERRTAVRPAFCSTQTQSTGGADETRSS